MIFDKSKYLTNDDGLVFKKIDTKINDSIIGSIRVSNKFEAPNSINYNIQRIDGKSKFLLMKNPPSYERKIKFNNYVEPLDRNISIDVQEVINTHNDDIPKITNGIRNRAYFLTKTSKWTRIKKWQNDNDLIKIENNIKD